MQLDGDPSSKRSTKRRWILIGVATALVFGVVGPSAYALVQGALYATSGRAATMATYANDFQLPSNPAGAAFDGNSVWIANIGANSVTRITQGSVASFALPANSTPFAVAFDGTSIWTANGGNSTVSKLNLSGTLLNTYLLASGSAPGAIAFDGTNMWTANTNNSTVSKIVVANGTVTNYSLLAGSFPISIAFDGVNMWTANRGNSTVSKITPAGVVTTTGIGNGIPRSIAFDGTYMWTANANGTVTKITLAGNVAAGYTIAASTAEAQGPQSIAFDQPGYTASGDIDQNIYMWVANYGLNSVTKVDVNTGNVVATYPVGRGPYSIVFDGTNIWVVERLGSAIARIRVR